MYIHICAFARECDGFFVHLNTDFRLQRVRLLYPRSLRSSIVDDASIKYPFRSIIAHAHTTYTIYSIFVRPHTAKTNTNTAFNRIVPYYSILCGLYTRTAFCLNIHNNCLDITIKMNGSLCAVRGSLAFTRGWCVRRLFCYFSVGLCWLCWAVWCSDWGGGALSTCIIHIMPTCI